MLHLEWTLFRKNPTWCKQVKEYAKSLNICQAHTNFRVETCYRCKISRDTCQAKWEEVNVKKVRKALSKTTRNVGNNAPNDESDYDVSAMGVTWHDFRMWGVEDDLVPGVGRALDPLKFH